MSQLLIAHTPLGKDWWVISLQGNEALSSLYEFRLELKSENPDIDIQSMIGEACTVECKDGPLSSIRYFSGLAIATKAKGKPDKHWLYELTIAPKLWFASRRADFKIYQNLTAQAIADEVLQRNAILDHEWRLNSSYKTWEYVVQYGETDLAFLLRLLGHEGIYFWFEHGKDGEKLILGDHFNRHDPFAGYEKIPYYPSDAPLVEEDHFNSWRTSRVAEPGKFVQTSYDFQHPSENLKAESADPRGHLFDQYEIFSYRGSYAESEHSQEYAAAQLHGMQSDQNVTVLEGPVRGAIPGCRFTLEKHPVKSQNCDFTIISAEYRARNNEHEADDNTPSEEEASSFHVKISAIPADRQYRTPSDKFKMPRAHGSDTAVVVGPEGSEIHTDKYGRIKVHFHWDRYGQKDGSDSCWIRVASPWAGTSVSTVSIPRVGQEVVIDYEHGDPQQPIVTSCIHNAQQAQPWELPANKTQSGFMSRSTPDGGPENFNALRFENAKGREEVWLHAEKDQRIEVENDESHSVDHDRTKTIGNDETVDVGHDRTESVGNNETITIGNDHTETVGNDETIDIGNDRTETVGNNETINIGNDRTESVGNNETIDIGAAHAVTVGDGQTFTVTGDQTFTITGNNKYTATESTSFSAGTTYDAHSGGDMTLESGTTIVDLVGNAVAMINPNTVAYTVDETGASVMEKIITHGVDDSSTMMWDGAIVHSSGDSSISIQAESIVHASDDSSIEIQDGSIVLRSGKTSLQLSADGVAVNGKKIFLNC